MSPDDHSDSRRLAAWFLGPKAENAQIEEEMILYILRDYFHWRRNYYPADRILITRQMQREHEAQNDLLFQQVSDMLARLRRHFPFYSPRYIAHMLSDQTLPSVLGYFAGMLYNPNNVTPEAAPVTVEWELEVGADVLKMLGYTPPPAPDAAVDAAPAEFGWAHITSGGTVANLEALWVARNIRYFPLALREVVRQERMPLNVRLTGTDDAQPLAAFSVEQALGIRPDVAIHLLGRFVDAVRRHYDITPAQAAAKAWALLRASGFSIAHSGTQSCYAQMPPLLFASGAAHYSLTKSAEVLGIGSDQIVRVDVDSRFRMDVADLERRLRRAVTDGQLPLAVIAIASTTEEGAVDPIHEIAALRTRLESELGVSFWLHVDAAWGGYIRAVFCDDAAAALSEDEQLAAVARFVSRTLDDGTPLSWGGGDVGRAYLAVPQAESVTVDPHKMGYVPYPAGIVAFRHDRVRHFLTQEAPYITATTPTAETEHASAHLPPTIVGAFVLEGSKPGAAAASCWLSHRVIPPDRAGYGQIVRASLLAARELYERLVGWEAWCGARNIDTRYQFIPVGGEAPDTNILCFVVKDKTSRSLARMNALTQRVYKRFTIEAELGEREYSYAQPFFLSRTRFEAAAYPPDALRPFFERANVHAEDYAHEGVFVLRATLMTPYITMAAEIDHAQDYIGDFLAALAQRADQAVVEMYRE